MDLHKKSRDRRNLLYQKLYQAEKWPIFGGPLSVLKLKLKLEKARKPLWNKEKRAIRRLPVFGLSDKTWTCGLYHPKGDLNIFLVILSFFRPFRYGKNDLSRSRGILSPGAPIVSMVVYVVVKIRSQMMALASWERMIFYNQQRATDPVPLAASAYQGCRIVTLLQPFVKRFKIKNCTAIIQEKGSLQSSPSSVCRCIGTRMMEMVVTIWN